MWHCDITAPDGSRVRCSAGTEDKRLAQEYHDTLKAQLWRTHRLGEAPAKTFDEACLRWLNEKSDKKSIDDDKTRMGFWLQHFSGKLLSSITELAIAEAISKLENRKHRENWEAMRDRLMRLRKPVPKFVPKPVAVATKASYLAFIRSLLRIAANEWKWLDRLPTVKTPKLKNKRIRWITHAEANLLIKGLPDYLKPVVTFALATGLRKSNIVDLEWSQIDMQRKVCWIYPEDAKAGKAIGVALNDTACGVLREQIGKHHQFVFVREVKFIKSKRKEQVYKIGDFRKAFGTACANAGIDNFRFHDLRHTWASWLVQAGTPLSALKEMGGWETLDMVMRYAHLAPNHLAEHAKQIDGMLNANDTNSTQDLFASSLKQM
ncbi:tyrosine-type recombinase/integrase [Tolumonas lignilytica]|uniref:tyrosine-type recombinase/integrase n=1 Tax=Tolumonas lignilytica TaxID=1283284 RepID=UPI003B831B1B